MSETQPWSGPRRATFILTVWSDAAPALVAPWRGCLESGNGQRYYFRTLTDLNRLLVEGGGWVDPPQNQLEVS